MQVWRMRQCARASDDSGRLDSSVVRTEAGGEVGLSDGSRLLGDGGAREGKGQLPRGISQVISRRTGWHAWALSHTWKDLQGQVDAAFSWEDKLYLIQGSQVTIYRSAQGYSRVAGYPRALQEELGVAAVDAAFTCPHSKDLYLIQGNAIRARGTCCSEVGAPALCSAHPTPMRDSSVHGLGRVYHSFHGPSFHHYASVQALLAATAPAAAQDTAAAFFKCPATRGGDAPQDSRGEGRPAHAA
ncbi:hemopexin [Sphaerodactylus townsendi]|uniref:hemopexin n=1 Tax=Sphaerodactylus townsendi TaxID=933632 RepID=UPI0020272893|nr:hemopexin [Sphaerodactylus townsendi]